MIVSSEYGVSGLRGGVCDPSDARYDRSAHVTGHCTAVRANHLVALDGNCETLLHSMRKGTLTPVSLTKAKVEKVRCNLGSFPLVN